MAATSASPLPSAAAGGGVLLVSQQLLHSGRIQVANLRGGLRRWGDEGYPLAGVVG